MRMILEEGGEILWLPFRLPQEDLGCQVMGIWGLRLLGQYRFGGCRCTSHNLSLLGDILLLVGD